MTNEFVQELKEKYKEDIENISELQKILNQLKPKVKENIYYKFIATSAR